MNEILLDNEDILALVREVSANPHISQRELSSRLGLSLGKINFLMRALCEKGLVKAENFRESGNKIAYIYRLTPAGIKERYRLTRAFLARKAAEYERLQNDLRGRFCACAGPPGRGAAQDRFCQ